MKVQTGEIMYYSYDLCMFSDVCYNLLLLFFLFQIQGISKSARSI